MRVPTPQCLKCKNQTSKTQVLQTPLSSAHREDKFNSAPSSLRAECSLLPDHAHSHTHTHTGTKVST